MSVDMYEQEEKRVFVWPLKANTSSCEQEDVLVNPAKCVELSPLPVGKPFISLY